MSEENAFYHLLEDGDFEATGATAGPWSESLQHGGPPSALLARAMEMQPSPVPQRLVRLTVEIMRPVPVARLRISASIVRPGRRVTLLEATGSAAGVECLRARGWKIEIPDLPGPTLAVGRQLPAIPERSMSMIWPGAHVDGYTAAIEWRPTSGSLSEIGPADVWARPRLPLVHGEPTSPFCRAALLADSGSGVGLGFDLSSVFSINVDLTVTMWRDLAGDWVFMSSRTFSDQSGAGMAETDLGDADGIAGKALQSLVVSGRPAH